MCDDLSTARRGESVQSTNLFRKPPHLNLRLLYGSTWATGHSVTDIAFCVPPDLTATESLLSRTPDTAVSSSRPLNFSGMQCSLMYDAGDWSACRIDGRRTQCLEPQHRQCHGLNVKSESDVIELVQELIVHRIQTFTDLLGNISLYSRVTHPPWHPWRSQTLRLVRP